MRAVVQRVREARARWKEGEAAIGGGFVIFVGVAQTDQESDADRLADKIVRLRVFPDAAGKFNLSAAQVQAQFLVVPQFTLFGELRGQNRPSFLAAARPEKGRPLTERFIERLRASGALVQSGAFGSHMAVEAANDGPVTLVLSTDRWEPSIG